MGSNPQIRVARAAARGGAAACVRFLAVAATAVAASGAALVVGAAAAHAQPASPAQLTVGLYAPSAAFSDSSARLAYVQSAARAIQARTGIPTVGRAYVRLGDLTAARPDFAILDGPCIVAKAPGVVLATAVIGGEAQQPWGLFAREATTLAKLRGAKLAYARSGCRDADQLDNLLLESEAKAASFFGALVDKPDVAGAVAVVRDYRSADAVFAPASQGRGLVRVLEVGAVPNPGFVVMSKALPAAVVDQAKEAVLGLGGGAGAIDGWRAAVPYASLAARLAPRTRRPLMAAPELVKLDVQDAIALPALSFEEGPVLQHFWAPAPQARPAPGRTP